MELRHLRYFIAVAEELHFSRAAERLHVSQPPLSQQIKQLEEEVKVQLLDRTRRWVRLTSAGRLFLEHARQVLAQVDRAVLAARQTTGGECDRLSVACTPWADLIAVPRILHRLSEVHRQIQIEVQTLNSVLQVGAVKARTVDVGFMLPPPADQGLQIERLVKCPLVVALPADHRLAARAQLSPRDLAEERYVMLAADVDPMYTWPVTAYWERAGVAVKERLKVDQGRAMIDLVAAGAGFALVPSSVREYWKEQIVCRRLDPAPPELELSLAWAPGVESPTINALLEVARQVVGQRQSALTGEGRADSYPGSSDLPAVGRPSRPGETGQALTKSAHQLGARSSLLRPPLRRLDGDPARNRDLRTLARCAGEPQFISSPLDRRA
jgi:DNA-binding transcriptional LysR family regulator